MAIYLVNQSQTYRHERAGNYIWSPKLDKAGHRNRGYELMKEVRKGDYIIHNSGGYFLQSVLPKRITNLVYSQRS